METTDLYSELLDAPFFPPDYSGSLLNFCKYKLRLIKKSKLVCIWTATESHSQQATIIVQLHETTSR